MALYKDYECTIEKANDNEQSDFVAIVSTENPDRDNDVLVSRGMIHRTHPMFLWFHGFDPNHLLPPGRINWTKASRTTINGESVNCIKAALKFSDNEWGQALKKAYIDQDLRYFSLAAIPLEFDRREGEDRGYEFKKWDCFEISAVPIPANCDTGVIARMRKEYQERYDEGKLQLHPGILAYFGITKESESKSKGEIISVEFYKFILKPFPNFHSCRVADPDDFDKIRYAKDEREHNGKNYDVVYGHKKGGDEHDWADQAYRYPKETWDADAARSHCQSHKGSFTAASQEESLTERRAGMDVIRFPIGECKSQSEIPFKIKDA